MSRLASIKSLPVYVFVFVFVYVFSSCRDHQFTTDPSARLTFSQDSVSFDTVFTAAGSSTQIIMIYNHNANALRISQVRWARGKCFFANVNGENNSTYWNDLTIYGHDSMYLFLRCKIDPLAPGSNPLEHDTLFFRVNGHEQALPTQAYGLNVCRIRGKGICDTYHFEADQQPYLLYDSMVVRGQLTIDPGVTIYMHQGAFIRALGSVSANGTSNAPIRIMGDRTDYLFPHVPYRVASGQWSGFYLCDTVAGADTLSYRFQHIHLLSGQVGLYCKSHRTTNLSTLHLYNARIHNMSGIGLAIENTNARIANTEVSNCAGYGIYLNGGTHRIEQSTIANYYGYPYTTINIHSASRWNVASVYIQATSTTMARDTSYLINSIITGATYPALVIDSLPNLNLFTGQLAGCFLSCDSDSLIQRTWAKHNVFGQKNDSLFKNTYYKYGEYIYYDYHLVERSKARRIGLPLQDLLLHPWVDTDMENLSRDPQTPDAGCYTYQ